MSEVVKIGIVGVSGYLGGEFVCWFYFYFYVEFVVLCVGEQVGCVMDESFFGLCFYMSFGFIKFDWIEFGEICDVVFFVLLYGVVMEVVFQLFEVNIKVIDLGGDFCLVIVLDYECWYGIEYCSVYFFEEVVYGLLELYCEVVVQS